MLDAAITSLYNIVEEQRIEHHHSDPIILRNNHAAENVTS